MATAAPWFVIAGIVVAGWLVSGNRPEAARKTARLLPIAVGIVLLSLAVSGWIREFGDATQFHRWAGHACVIIVWLGVAFSAGVLIQQHARRRPSTAVCQLIAFVVLLCTVSLAAFCGYLGPSHVEAELEETRNRFQILHLYFLPTLIAGLLFEWWWFFSRCSAKVGSYDRRKA